MFILVISFPVISEAAQMDFVWSTPEFLSDRKDSEDLMTVLIGKSYEGTFCTFSFKSLPDLNRTTLFGGTSTVVPVLGFLPILAPLSTVVRIPKSLNSKRFPFTSSSVHNSKKSWIICLVTIFY